MAPSSKSSKNSLSVHQLGIMQGRLSPPEGGRIQSFPAKTWRREFALAKECGLDRIEWIVDEPAWETNPLVTAKGRKEIAALVEETGVQVKSACADLFMIRPLHSAPTAELSRRCGMLAKIIEAAGEAGLEHIDIPFVDASAIRDDTGFREVAQIFRHAGGQAQVHGVTLCLETSLEPARFRMLLEAVDRSSVKANYDIGNSASLGYDPASEIAAIGHWIHCVHIKDRQLGASTVSLGTGNADFKTVFQELKKAEYRGHFILQTARGSDEVQWTKRNAAFAHRWIETLGNSNGSGTQ